MNKRFVDKVVLITGAAQGVGKETTKLFVNEGAKAYISDINYDGVKKLEIELVKSGFKVIAAKADISNFNDIKAMVSGAIKEFGSIDILINNAAVPIQKPMMDLEWEDWDLVLDVNVKGTFFVLQSVAYTMIKEGKGGSIVNIASLAGEGGRPLYFPYAASKAAVINMTLSAAKELAKCSIRVNAVSPGMIDTKMFEQCIHNVANMEKADENILKDSWINKIPLKRLAKPEDIAKAVLFLCSSEAGYITGQILNVCGGLSIP